MVLLTTPDGLPITNAEAVLLPPATRAATTQSTLQTNHAHRGVVLWLDVTANPGGAASLTLRLLAADPASGVLVTYALWPDALTAANGTRRLVLYPGATAAPADPDTLTAAGLPLPRTWAVQVTHSGPGPWTYSVACSLLL
jgi:hypothetical protein